MKREAFKNQTMSLDMEKMLAELAEKYYDALVQKHIWRSSTQKEKDLAQEIIEVSDKVSKYYPYSTPKFFGFTFVCDDDNVYLEFLLDEEVPDDVKKRHALFSIEELREIAMLSTDYVAVKIINKAKEVAKHDTLLKCGYIPVFLFFVGDKDRCDYFEDIYDYLYRFMNVLERYYEAGFMYCVVAQNRPVISSETIVPDEPKPLSGDVYNFGILDVAIRDKEGSLFFVYDFYKGDSLFFWQNFVVEYIGKVKDISLDMLLDYIIEAVVRAKEIYKAVNSTFDAVYMRFWLTEDCLQSVKDLKEFLERTPYIRSAPPIFFSLDC